MEQSLLDKILMRTREHLLSSGHAAPEIAEHLVGQLSTDEPLTLTALDTLLQQQDEAEDEGAPT